MASRDGGDDDRGDLSGVRSTWKMIPDEATGDVRGMKPRSKGRPPTLSDYLADRTAGGAEYGDRQRPGGNKNRFQVKPPGSEQETISHQNDGMPSELKPASTTDPDKAGEEWASSGHTIGTYMDLVRDVQDQGADTNFVLLSTSDYGGAENPFTGILEKNSQQQGHTLLPSIKPILDGGRPGAPNVDGVSPPDDAPEIQKKISMVLKNNRFSPEKDTPFIENHTQTHMGFTIQNTLGTYTPGQSFVSSAHGILGGDGERAELMNIGLALMINATGEAPWGDDAFVGHDPADTTSDTVLLPSFTQLGAKKVATDKLRAQYAFGAGAVGGDPPADYISLDNQQSYGQLNSYLEPFDGPLPLAMVVQCLAGVAVLVGFSALLSLVTGGFKNGGSIEHVPDPKGLSMGHHKTPNFGMDFLSLLGIPKTNNHFMGCMFEGICAFYGIPIHPKKLANPVTAIDIVVNLAMAPGYYAGVTRAVVRDVEQIIDAFKGFANPMSGISGGITQVVKVIESIVTSTTWKFLMTMVKLGDISIDAVTGHPRIGGDIDSIAETAVTRVRKSRVTVGKRSMMAWRHSSSPARYLLPASFSKARHLFDEKMIPTSNNSKTVDMSMGPSTKSSTPDESGNETGLGSGRKKYDGAASDVKGRLSGEYVEWIENQLESEYMPFYFHDLRTNEIISFHAFIESMSDGFSVDYSSTAGYGRVDEVKVYNKTSRSISMTFSLIATSKDDLSIMYYNVNKLVSMCYPQWSRGRAQLGSDSGGNEFKFIQPFSQIPTASPMIRLRLGDWFKSNYSKFGLARLFGAGADGMLETDLTAEQGAANIKKAKEAQDEAEKWQAKKLIDPLESGDNTNGFVKGDKVACQVSRGYMNPKNKDGEHPDKKDKAQKKWLRRVKCPDTITGVIEVGADGNLEPLKKTRKDKIKDENGKEADKDTPIAVYRVKVDDDYFPEGWSDEFRFAHIDHSMSGVPHAAFVEYKTQKYNDKSPATPGDAKPLENRKKFLIDNPLAKAFESTRGRGLAGFITQMDFDQAEAPWEIEMGFRAPQMLKVSISFAPVHDLAPGLDHDGMMTAPVYNIGTAVGSIGRDPHYHDGFLGDRDSINNPAVKDQAEAFGAAGASEKEPGSNPSDDDGSGGLLGGLI